MHLHILILLSRNDGLKCDPDFGPCILAATELICQLQVNFDPLRISFSLIADLTLGSGITVPAGAILVVPLHLVQMDASVWGNDAGQFNPHRFLKKDIVLGGMFSLPLFFSSHFSVLAKHK
jgi:hypothetical protein